MRSAQSVAVNSMHVRVKCYEQLWSKAMHHFDGRHIFPECRQQRWKHKQSLSLVMCSPYAICNNKTTSLLSPDLVVVENVQPNHQANLAVNIFVWECSFEVRQGEI